MDNKDEKNLKNKNLFNENPSDPKLIEPPKNPTNLGDDGKKHFGGSNNSNSNKGGLNNYNSESNEDNKKSLFEALKPPQRNKGRETLDSKKSGNNDKNNIQPPDTKKLTPDSNQNKYNMSNRFSHYNGLNNNPSQPSENQSESTPQAEESASETLANDAKNVANKVGSLSRNFMKGSTDSSSSPGNFQLELKKAVFKKIIPIILIAVALISFITIGAISSAFSGGTSTVYDLFDADYFFGDKYDELSDLDNKELKKLLNKMKKVKDDFTKDGKSFDHIMVMATINAIIYNDKTNKLYYDDFGKSEIKKIAEAVSGKSDEEIKANLADNIIPKYIKLKDIKEESIVTDEETIETTNNQTPATTSKGYKIENRNGVYYINDIAIANKSYDVSPSYNPGGLSEEFNTAFGQMQKDASNKGIKLEILNNGFRSYEDQQKAYNTQVNEKGSTEEADKVSSRPGHSEHQLGNTADINSLKSSFADTTAGQWLNNNCYKYGFIIRYPKGKDNYTGYEYEPWHIRYVGKDLAKELYNNGDWITLEEHLGITSDYNKPANLTSQENSGTVEAKNKNTPYYSVAEDAIFLRNFYYEIIGKENQCITGGSCNYTIPGFNINGESRPNTMTINNLKVRLMQSSRTGLKDGEPMPDVDLVDFEKYVLGTAYGEIGCDDSTSEDYFKTQLVAVRSFSLSRPSAMGNSRGVKYVEENGQKILQMRSSVDDHQYCDPDTGCSYDAATCKYKESYQLYQGLSHKCTYHNPLSQDSKCRKWASDVMGEVLVDSNGYVLNTGYKSKDQAIFKNSTNYKQTLLSHYKNSNTINPTDCNAGGDSTCAYGISTGDYANWSQYCPECKNVPLGRSKATIDSAGCAATSLAMLIAKSGADTSKIEKEYRTFNHITFVKAMNKAGGFNGAEILWYQVNKVVPNFVYVDRNDSFHDQYPTEEAKIKHLQELVNKGYYVVLQVKCKEQGTHFVALDAVQNGHVYIMDPATKSKELWKNGSTWKNQACTRAYRTFRKT